MKRVLIGLMLVGSNLVAGEPQPADAKALGKQLMSNLSGIFYLDWQNQEKLGGRKVPAIQNGNWVISSHPVPLVDSFTAQTHSIATIFVKVNEEFVRLMTTETHEKAGTILDHAHPAYKRLIGELRYTNQVTLAGKEYMADYDVFRDRQGRVIGAYLVAIPFSTTGNPSK